MSKPKPKKRGPGRPPPGGKPASAVVKLRVMPSERDGWLARAKHAGVSLSEWIRQRCAS